MIKSTTEQLVHYDPYLVELLKAEHNELTSDCDLILRFMKDSSHLEELNKTFNNFASLLGSHFAHERQLYLYLEFVVSKGDGRFKDTRCEMREIAASVNSIILLYTNISINKNNLTAFRKDFAKITKTLIYRMRKEEKSLFTEYSNHPS